MDAPSILPILQKIPLLQELDEANHKQIIEHIKLNYYPPNYQLFAEGEVGDKLYIIKSGMVKIFKTSSGEDVALLKANDFFGEMALFSDNPRNASAVTLEECELFTLDKVDFYALVAQNPQMANILSTEFVARMKSNQENKK